MPYSQSLVIDGRTYTRGDVPDGWRMISPGEPIQPGDRVYWSHGIRYGYGLRLAQGPEACPDAHEIWAQGRAGYLLGPGDYGRVIRRISVRHHDARHHDARSNARIRITSVDATTSTAEIRRGKRVIVVTKTLAARQARDTLVAHVKRMREARAVLARLPRNSELYAVRQCVVELKEIIRDARENLRLGLSIRAERGRRTEILLPSDVGRWTVTISTGLPRLLSYGPVSSYELLGTGRSRTRLSELAEYGASMEEQVGYSSSRLKDAYDGAKIALRNLRTRLRTPDEPREIDRVLPRSGVRLLVPSMHHNYDRKTGQSARSGWVLRQLKTLDKTAILNGDAPRPQIGERYVGIEIECYVRPEACSRPCHCLDDEGEPYRYCESCNGDGIQYHTRGSSFEPIADVLVRHGVKRGEVSLTSDGSLGSHHLGIPVEVRVLASESRLDEVLTKVCGALAEMHARVDGSCGGHVHIDCRASTGRIGYEVYRRLVCALPLLANMVEESRVNGDSEYCRLNRDPDEFNDGDRYYAVNAESLSAHGTIEVRLSHGMLEKGEILMWCRTLIQIADHGGDLTSRVRKLSTFFQRLKIEENPMLRHFILHRVYQYCHANDHCGSRYTLLRDIADPALSERPAEVIAA